MTNAAIDRKYKHPELRAYARKIRNQIKSGKLVGGYLARDQQGRLNRRLKKAENYIATTKDDNGKETRHKGKKFGLVVAPMKTLEAFVDSYAFELGIAKEDM